MVALATAIIPAPDIIRAAGTPRKLINSRPLYPLTADWVQSAITIIAVIGTLIFQNENVPTINLANTSPLIDIHVTAETANRIEKILDPLLPNALLDMKAVDIPVLYANIPVSNTIDINTPLPTSNAKAAFEKVKPAPTLPPITKFERAIG